MSFSIWQLTKPCRAQIAILGMQVHESPCLEGTWPCDNPVCLGESKPVAMISLEEWLLFKQNRYAQN